MDVQRLSYFCELVRLGSFTAAARRLGLTQPALSKSIRLLESEVGSTLVLRGQRGRGTVGVRPTAVGKALFQEAERILNDIAGIEGRLQSLQALQRVNLSIGASDNFSNHFLPGVWSEFSARHPSAGLTVFSGTSEAIQAELLARRVEIGLSYHESSHAKLVSRKVAQAEFVIVSARALQLKELASTPYIGSIAEDYRGPYAALKILRDLGIRPRQTIHANQQEVQKNMALRGLGYTVVPKFIVADELRAGDLRAVSLSARPRVPIYLTALNQAKPSPLVANFQEHLIAQLQAFF